MTNFVQNLLQWYSQNCRDLPWRYTTDPYAVWLSEIILQQTKVDQGMDYYRNFISRYPTIYHLATASLDEVLLQWQGLGYYSRARNLHATAKYLANEREGIFPCTAQELAKLKGVGPYTAAAIASFCFQQPVPVLDGNVYRFLSRFFAVDLPIDSQEGRRRFEQLATELMDHNQPGEFNQAMMEFGSLQCTPRNPHCDDCVFAHQCKAFERDVVFMFPVKSKKALKRTRFFQFLVVRGANGFTYVQKRIEKDIWHSLYQFPLEETLGEVTALELMTLLEKKGLGVMNMKVQVVRKHMLTHQRLEARFWTCQLEGVVPADWVMIPWSALEQYAFPRLIQTAIRELDKSF